MADLTEFLPKLLIGSGGLMQFLRAAKDFPEWAYHVAAVLCCTLAYFLTTPLGQSPADFRIAVVHFLVWLPDNLPLVWGGTFAISNAAKAAATRVDSSHPLVPVTNSK